MKFDEIELLLLDFDDTLAVHDSHLSEKDWLAYDDTLSGKSFSEISINWHMKKFMEFFKEQGTSIGLISATEPAMRADDKISWVEQQYGIRLLNFCVPTVKDKLRIAKSYAKVNGVQRSSSHTFARV